MLEKFISINKVGLFESCSYLPGCDFGEVTLIYGDNGVGKSTLAAIIDALREGNVDEIIRRRSLPGNVAPSVAIRVNGGDYVFDGNNWDKQLPHDTLDVFYPGFVTRNVHSATGIDPEHSRKLCEFVIGRQAVDKVTRLASADAESRTVLSDLKTTDKQLQLLIKGSDTLEVFLGLSSDPKIDENMEKVRTELKQAQNKDSIIARAVPESVSVPTIDKNKIINVLEKSIDSMDISVTEVVKKHINQHLDDDGENWLEYGIKHVKKNNKCPFCSQDITRSDIVAAIRSYFSAEYRSYTKVLMAEIKTLHDQLGATTYSSISTALSVQVAVASQWAGEISIDKSAVATDLSAAEKKWQAAAGKLETLLATKQTKPLDKMDATLAGEVMTDYEDAQRSIDKVNKVLMTISKKAEEKKSSLSKASTIEIEQRLKRLENQKTRFEPLTKNLIDKRNGLIDKRARLETEKVGLKKEIDESAIKVIGKYQTGINYYLEHFGCDIRIESIEPKFPSGRASVQYVLKAHGHEIELGISIANPCFETVLSDGDKYTLALSFFLARLKDISSLAGRVIVLDDPVNSFGAHRRTLVEGIIRDLNTRGAQIIILTHDERLAALIWRDGKLNKKIVSLQVERTRTGSHLRPWDVERATQSEYVRQYLAIDGYLEHGGDHMQVAPLIRPYLEHRIRHLFPGTLFETRDSLGDIIAKIRKSTSGSRLEVLKTRIPDLESINESSLPSHHASDNVPGMTPPTPEAVRLFAEKAFKF